MKESNTEYKLWPPIVYPATMTIGICLFYLLKNMQFHLSICAYIPITFCAAAITFFELYIPHKRDWIPNKQDVWNDTLFLVTIQMALPKILSFLVAMGLLTILNLYNLQLKAVWPHHWNIAVQTIMMVLIGDLFRYWFHKFSHINPILWKLHAIHHSPKKLYWLNVGRFHPIEKALQFLFDAMPFIILGVAEEVLACYFVFYAVNGFFQHCNIELKMGLLNFIISGPQLHRWHHSVKVEESNTNYGNNVIIWDILFGTYFFPKKKLVKELGLKNKSYPLDYISQMKTPFSGEIDKILLPLQDIGGMVLNRMLKIKMFTIKHKLYDPLVKIAEDPLGTQNRILLSIIRQNEKTEFGRYHKFFEIKDYESFKRNVPIYDYEGLRPYITKQENEKLPILTSKLPFMYNQTSGTTGKPKYIPVFKQTIKMLKKSQQVFSYVQYKSYPEAFYGKLLGLVSPAIEGYLESGTPYGSTSGHIYNTMPLLAKLKYALPGKVFEIQNYEAKYYIISRLALEHKNITFLGSANPSSFHKLLEVINKNYQSMIDDISNGTCKYIDTIDSKLVHDIHKRLRPNSKRSDELAAMIHEKKRVSFYDIWPYLKILVTWTGASCGISLNSILPAFPKGMNVFDLGYLSSEMRGTITINPKNNEGLPTIQENFFEFISKEDWEKDKYNFITIEQLQRGKEYYLFVTTPTGLYRYNMNDIVHVTGKFGNTPTFKFLQKGKGVTNITGEKLYENQLIVAMQKMEVKLKIEIKFYQMLANERNSQYELYIEFISNVAIDLNNAASFLDSTIQDENIEYKTKRSSQRLKQLAIYRIKQGTFELYKASCLTKGQREGQFKPQILQHKNDFTFDIGAYSINEN